MTAPRPMRKTWRSDGRLAPASAHLRSRAVRLRPGARMAWHTTGAREELLIAVQGGVIVETRAQRRMRRTALAGGYALFLPPHVEHQVVNVGRSPARYIYVTG